MSTVCVVGLGYIGLPVAAMLASRGHDVVGYDVNPRVIQAIHAGRAHFFEPDLDMLLKAAISTRRFRAQDQPTEAEFFVIAVPTPFQAGHKPDTSYIEKAVETLAPFLRTGSTIILESTSPVGTTERIAEQLRSLRTDLRFPVFKEDGIDADVQIAHCPERILPGQMLKELTTNDRIIGGMTSESAQAAMSLYGSFVQAECFITDCRTAELVKLVENSYRDVNIAFANELSLICNRLQINVWDAIELANKHPRVNILRPGAGVGGHCIAVDPWFIVDAAPDDARLIRTAREVNDNKPHYIVNQILSHAQRFKDPVVACFGITYKPDVEDTRESPALEIVRSLAASDGVHLIVCDPLVKEPPRDLEGLNRIRFAGADEARIEADIAAFLVPHRQFRRIEPNLFLNKIVVDATGMLSNTMRAG